MFLCETGDTHVQDGSSGPDAIARLQRQARKSLAHADHHARHAAVAHQKVRADTDGIDRYVARRSLEEIRKIGFVRGRKEDFCRATRTEPDQVRQCRFGLQPAAHGRQPLQQRLAIKPRHHAPASPSKAASWPGKA